MKITCAYNYRLNPTDKQRAALSRSAGCCRFVYNKALALQNERKESKQLTLHYSDIAKLLVGWKKEPDMAFLKEAPSQALQQTLMDQHTAIEDAFRKGSDPARKGWPKFKAKDCGDGFRIPQIKPEHIDEGNSCVRLPKIGWVKYFNSRPMAFKDKNDRAIRGKVKQVSITKDADKWYASFTIEFDVELSEIKDSDVGIDIGVVHAIATSDGKFFDLDVAKIKRLEAEIAKWQRKLELNKASRKKLAELGKAKEFDKKEPSRKRRRILERIRKLNYKIRCIRQDFYKKTAHALAQEYGCVYAEDLKVGNMTKSAKGTIEEPGKNVKQKSGLNRAILRTGFSGLIQAIGWAMTKTGGIVVKVDPKYTSRQCPKCGCEDKKNRPRQAVFKCCRCGHSDNADTNGAVNVRIRGRAGPIAHDKKAKSSCCERTTLGRSRLGDVGQQREPTLVI